MRQRRTTALNEYVDKLNKELPIPLTSFWPSLGDAFTPSKKRKSNFPQPKATPTSPKKTSAPLSNNHFAVLADSGDADSEEPDENANTEDATAPNEHQSTKDESTKDDSTAPDIEDEDMADAVNPHSEKLNDPPIRVRHNNPQLKEILVNRKLKVNGKQ
ncbi:unnamed protein product [Ambrosiozyma monospora]|uniref:Unnamed protein product n=1 Tax=Ambrosiozyma monospora TaxID=43982 RepID=A0A9W6YRH5_AMBMO|nr:unnamed protein product [Ambrosiozyma monospora]